MQVWQAFRKVVICCLFSCVMTVAALETFADTYYWIELPEQPLISSLNELSEIGNFNWGATFDAERFKGQIGRPIKGYLTTRQAVEELFKESTTIQYQWVGGGLEISEAEKSAKPRVSIVRPMIEEISVIGSHIRGAKSASPVIQINREVIENSGLSSTHELLNSLPQVFGGGAGEGAVASIKGDGADLNIADANGVNLFGVGSDSTLVLLNGHRMAPVGFGDVIDVSGIPLSAIERIDIMADGASAIYGSDAVSGVVNIILRRDYDGMETQVGYGDVTDGSNQSYQISHIVGRRWQGGNILFNYNYFNRNNLSASDRSVTQNAVNSGDILGKKTQHDVMLSVSQQLTDHAEVYADLFYSSRENQRNKPISEGNNFVSQSVSQFNFVGGGNIDLNDDWRVGTSQFYSESSTVSSTAGAFNGIDSTTLSTWGLEIKLDGPLFNTGADNARLALGGQYRQEAFTFNTRSEHISGNENSSRYITAIFSELFVPLINESNKLPGLERLELSLAGRYEEYRDFGSKANPKIGLLWSPITGLNLRTTYSRSFRAPLLYELSEVVNPTQVVAVSLPDPEALEENSTPTLLVSGYNAELEPEQAINWTVGADFTPVAWPDFGFSITYFTINITDRIQRIFTNSELKNALTDLQYAPHVMRNPDVDLINFWVSKPEFQNFTDLSDLSKIGAFIDNRIYNISTVREKGLNFSFDYSLNTDVGDFNIRVGGTYLFLLESQITDNLPPSDILNTAYNPTKIRLRNSISWKRNNLMTTAFINYVGSYKNQRPDYEGNINAWTTMDLSVRYDIGKSMGGWLRDMEIFLNINNLFDRSPPFVSNSLGYNYDAANASAIGRRISLNIYKKW